MKGFIIFLIVLMAGCKPDKPGIPSGILPIDKMKLVMADMHIADAAASTKAQAGLDEQMLTSEYYLQIYKNNGVSRDEFIESYKFYEENPQLFNELYDATLGEISRREAALGK